MAAPLDINTENGRAAAGFQQEAASIVWAGNPFFTFIPTDDTGPARVDGVLVRGGERLAGVVEIKSRACTYEQFSGEFREDWLLSEEKLRDVAVASRLLGVPGYGVLYLPNSGLCLVTRLCDSDGSIVCNYRVDRTQTQATCNGGTARRLNAFIDMRNAKRYRKPTT